MTQQAQQENILELERQVSERTAELEKAVQDLKEEVDSHKKTIQDLHTQYRT
jgi:hypothetical protein